MDTPNNIDTTVEEFKREFNTLFDEKITDTKEEFKHWIGTKLRLKLNENLRYLEGLDRDFIKMREERDEALLTIPRGRFIARLHNKGGSLKKKLKNRFIKNKTQKKKK
jgi:hypothetical protein